MNNFFSINKQLTFNDVADIISQKKQLILGEEAKKRIVDCRNYLDKKLENNDNVFYGINTGFGSLCNTKISNQDLEKLQKNLLLSHACGTGDYVPREIVKLMLLLKIQSLSYGNSGVQLKTIETLCEFFNKDIIPVVYTLGSLGASGDLAPLAHLCLPLLGYGMVWQKSENNWVKTDAKLALQNASIGIIKLKSKEGLALINGTQFMAAYGVIILLNSIKLFEICNLVASISIDAFDCRLDPFDARLHQIRRHKGQLYTAERILQNLKGSEIAEGIKMHVQDPYAFRCIPQVHGASKDAIEYCKSVFETEINSVTDNPNIFPEDDTILSGGNFHGQPLAITLDFLAIALAELGSISERRTYQLISGLRGLPAFLVANPGLNSGLMIPQYTAASIVSQNKQFCTPASVDSIVSSNGQEDHVSMGANAATKCLKVYENLERIIAIELLNASQAIEFRKPKNSSPIIENYMANYRKIVAPLDEDRLLNIDIEKSIKFIQDTEIQKIN